MFKQLALRFAFIAVTACAPLDQCALGAQVESRWLQPVNGLWTDPTAWSTNPLFPNNHSPAGTTYHAIIDASGGSYSVTFGAGAGAVAVDTVTLDSPTATLRHSGGTLTAGLLDVRGGTFHFAGGTLRDTVLTAAPLGRVTLGTGGGFDNVTVASDVALAAGTIGSVNGLTLAPGGRIIAGAGLVHQFHGPGGPGSAGGTQTLGGSGEIVFDGPAAGTALINPRLGNPLVIGPGVTIRSGAGPVQGLIRYETFGAGIGIYNDGTIALDHSGRRIELSGVENRGHIRATAAGSIDLVDFRNTGTVTATNAFVRFSGTFDNPGTIALVNAYTQIDTLLTTAQLYTLNRSGGGTLIVWRGLDNAGAELDLDRTGTLTLNSAVTGGTLRTSNPNALRYMEASSMFGTRIRSPLTLSDNATITWVGVELDDVPVRLISPGVAGRGIDVASSLGGTGTITFAGSLAPTLTIAQNATIGPGITIRTETSGPNGGFVGNPFGSFTNAGTIVVPPGRSLTIAGRDWTNTGTIVIDQGTLVLGGNGSFANLGTIQRTGGRLVFAGSINNAGGTLDLTTGTLGPMDLGAATVVGGTIVSPGRPVTVYGQPGAVAFGTTSLSGVTLAADMLFTAYAGFTVTNDLTLGGSTVTFTNGRLSFSGSQTLSGNGQIVLDAPGLPAAALQSNHGLVIGPDVTIRTGANGGGAIAVTNLGNRGTISANQPGRMIDIVGSGWVNDGTIEAIDGGVLALTVPWTNNGTLRAIDATVRLRGALSHATLGSISMSGAEVVLMGTFNNAAATLAVRDPQRSITLGERGRIEGGVVTGAPGDALVVRSSSGFPASLSDVQLLAPVTIAAGRLETTDVDYAAGVTVLAGASYWPDGSWTNGGTVAVNGLATLRGDWSNTGTIVGQASVINTGGTWVNHGMIAASGGTLSLFGTWNSPGAITMSNGTVVIGGTPATLATLSITSGTLTSSGNFTTAQLRQVARTDSVVRIGSGFTLDNTGQTIDVADPAGPWRLAGGTLLGGRIANLGGGGAGSFAVTGGLFDGVSLAADVTVIAGGSVVCAEGLHLDGGRVTLLRPPNTGGTVVRFPSTSSVTGTGELLFDGAGIGEPVIFANAGTLTLGPGVTVRTGASPGGIGTDASATVNQGTVSAQSAGASIALRGTFVNEGLLEARGGGVVLARGGGALRNDGSLVIGAQSVFRAGGAMTNNGTIDVGGAVVVDYASASPLAELRAQLVTGYAGGSWNGAGINSSAAAAAAGHGVGSALASEVFTTFPAQFFQQTVDATTVLLRFTRYGDADVDGVVNLNDFDRLAANFGLAGGAVWSQGDFNYDGAINLNDFNRLAGNFGLSASGTAVTPADWAALAAAVPEPGCVVALAAVTLLRRRRAR